MELKNETIKKLMSSGVVPIIVVTVVIGVLLLSLSFLISITLGCVFAYIYTRFSAVTEKMINKRRTQ